MVLCRSAKPGCSAASGTRRDNVERGQFSAFRRIAMTGTFESFTDENMYFRFRLKAPDGTVVAIFRPFSDKSGAVSGISAVREHAGMGLITDLCPEIPASGSSTWPPPSP
jgi:uncharacterized protein YegP (UPF0339 family)